jgi:1-acyl-sn-glycerol-3-phosphate acyltransferase
VDNAHCAAACLLDMDPPGMNRISTYLWHKWRWLAIASGYVVFGLFGIVLKIVLLPFTCGLLNQSRPANQKRARSIIQFLWRQFLRYVRFIGGLNYRFPDQDRLGRPGQVIIANHPSLLDVVFMLAHARQSNCIVKLSLLDNPFLNSAIRACGYIPNDGSAQVIDHAVSALQSGQSILIFPEGTRTGDDNVICFHRGACAIALRGAAVITPVIIRMHPRCFKRNQPWYHIPHEKVNYEFIIGDDIDPAHWKSGRHMPAATRQLNAYLQTYFERELQK